MSARLQGLYLLFAVICLYVLVVNVSYYTYVRETTTKRRWFRFIQLDHEASGGVDLTSITRPEEDVHFVFSSSCTPSQEWQSQLLIWSFLNLAKQDGYITRIVSGCSLKQKQNLLASAVSHSRVRYHFTPPFPGAQRFYYINKPLGIDHWLKNADPPVNEAVVVILDPDMVMFDPVYSTKRVRYKRKDQLLCTAGCVNRHLKTPTERAAQEAFVHNLTDQVKPGFPLAQTYGLGSAWQQRINLTELCGEGSNADKIGGVELRHKYSIGPPYLLANNDVRRLAPLWVKYMEPVYIATDKSDLLADMYAYNLAAIELELPHIQLDNYMVSRKSTMGEAWPWIDKLLAINQSDGRIGPRCSDPLFMSSKEVRIKHIPSLLHYAQRYTADDTNKSTWVFGKGFLPKDFLSCGMPLLSEPPDTLIQRQTTVSNKHNAWMLCTAIKYVNEATTSWKQKNCRPDALNLEKRIRMFNRFYRCPMFAHYQSCWSHAKVI